MPAAAPALSPPPKARRRLRGKQADPHAVRRQSDLVPFQALDGSRPLPGSPTPDPSAGLAPGYGLPSPPCESGSALGSGLQHPEDLERSVRRRRS
eukprot:2313253-Alexandrium_andersonii.AAC.1